MHSNKQAANGNFYKDSGDIANFAETINIHSRIKSIDTFDQLAFDSQTFASGHRFESVADNGIVTAHFKTGASECILFYSVEATGKCYYGLYLEPTITTNGTAVYAAIRNQAAPISPTAAFYHTPTYSEIGTLALPRMIPASGSPSSKGGLTKTEQFVILPANTSVLISITNKAGTAADIAIVADWGEIGG